MKTIELVIFKFKENTTSEEEENFLEVTNALLKLYKGFISRTFSRDGDGHRMDAVEWATPEDARFAAQEIVKNASARSVFDKIDPSHMKFYHFIPVWKFKN